MEKDNSWDLTNKTHTKIKLSILRDYLNAWAKIFTNRTWCKQVYYIDCFAGRGKYHNQSKKDTIDGSPLVALNVARNIKTIYGLEMICFFVEKEPRVFNALRSFIESFKSDVKFQAIKGDINEKINTILNQTPDNRSTPIFFFIDPSGIDIKSESIEKMLNRSNIKEFLITYIQKGVERCLGFGSKIGVLPVSIQRRAISNLKKVEDFFGMSWQNLTKNEKENLKKYLNVFVEYNRNVVSDKDKLKFKVIDILYNQGRNKYYLIFASRNETALKIIEDIYIKTKVDGTLFKSLSNLEKKRMFHKKFEV